VLFIVLLYPAPWVVMHDMTSCRLVGHDEAGSQKLLELEMLFESSTVRVQNTSARQGRHTRRLRHR
jgi:hypothetical protein